MSAEGNGQEPIDLFLRRRSIRKFEERPVEPEKIRLLLQAAMAGPSAVNSQPWDFVVVNEPAQLEKLKNSTSYGRHNAPLAIVVCGSLIRAKNPAGGLYWVQDCSAAMENLLLASVALGLGGVWIGVHPMLNTVSAVRRTLRLPRTVTPLGIALLGYPAEEKPPRTQYDAARVHWQEFGQAAPGLFANQEEVTE